VFIDRDENIYLSITASRVRLAFFTLRVLARVRDCRPLRLLTPPPQGDDIEPRISLLENGDRDAAQMRSQPQVCENGRLRCVLEMSAMVKQDNFAAMRDGGSKSFA
jgi:hypothetical protein